MAPVLVVDADADAARALCDLLARAGVVARAASSAAAALDALEAAPFDAVIAALALPDRSGVDLLGAIGARWSRTPCVLTGETPTAPEIVQALRAGAADFLSRPYDSEEVALVAGKLVELARRSGDAPPSAAGAGTTLVCESRAMKETVELLRRAAASNATVLLRGETGTGKEHAARALHRMSARGDGPFVKVDCTVLPENLLESELFGYEKGAFTGAAARKPGRVELAQGGTLFIDEVGELPLALQAKVLRLLQDHEFERLGGSATTRVDCRVVVATHRNLEEMVQEGRFRQDLFYRLCVVPIWLPPLRARRDDIEPLARLFCRAFAQSNGRARVELDASAVRVLRNQRWEGNVRELQNFMERLVVMTDGELIGDIQVTAELSRRTPKFSTEPIRTTGALLAADTDATHATALEAELRAAERAAIERALKQSRGNRSLAARLLGVGRTTFYAKLGEHGLI